MRSDTLFHQLHHFITSLPSPRFGLLEDGLRLSSCEALALQGFKYPPNALGDSAPLPARIPPLAPAPGS